MRKHLFGTLIFIWSFSTLAHANSGIDFDFSIKGDRFSLDIRQEFKKPLSEIRKKFSPAFLPKISNVVKLIEIETINESISKAFVTSSKHGIRNTTVGTCTEKSSADDWTMICTLDLDLGDTADFFNSGTEQIHCLTSKSGSTCDFKLQASVKEQRRFIFYRSPEMLALGGIVELIHDQAVLGRVVNLNESASAAKNNLDESNIGTCLDQIYANHKGPAQKMAFANNALEVKSSLWRCNP